jgi:hypothetical protein
MSSRISITSGIIPAELLVPGILSLADFGKTHKSRVKLIDINEMSNLSKQEFKKGVLCGRNRTRTYDLLCVREAF